MQSKPRLLRITTVPISLKLLLEGQFNFFQQQGFDVLTVSAKGQEIQTLVERGIMHQVVNMTRSITPLQDLICLYRLIRLILKFKPDIIHTHTPKAGLLGMMAGWVCRTPVRMHTVAGLPLMEATGLKRWVLKKAEWITYRCAHKVYPNSIGLQHYLNSKFSTFTSKFKTLGRGSSNGIDTLYFSRNGELEKQAELLRKQYAIPEEAVVFCFVGRMVRDKGVVELVTAFQKLSSKFTTRLLLIGPFENELDPLPDAIMDSITNNIQIIVAGFQDDVRPWMMASDIFAFPSYREGFPNAVMQAACLEIPCIVSDINGCNEIIQHGETGLIVPVKDSEALYKAMLSLVKDREKRSLFGQRSRQFVVKNFDRQYVWDELLREYRTVISKECPVL